MATGRLLPGYGLVVETVNAGKLLPGYGLIVETQAAAAAANPKNPFGGIMLDGPMRRVVFMRERND